MKYEKYFKIIANSYVSHLYFCFCKNVKKLIRNHRAETNPRLMFSLKSFIMANGLHLLIFLSASFIQASVGYNKHISYKSLLECQEYQLDGSNVNSYKDFFELVKFKNNKFSEREHFRIKLYFLANQDAKILLKSTGSSAYEIGEQFFS